MCLGKPPLMLYHDICESVPIFCPSFPSIHLSPRKEQTTEALDRSDPKASKKKCKKKKKQDAASSCPSARPSEVSDPIMGKDELSMKEEEKEARERKLRKKAKKESKRAAELLKISEAETAETEVKEPADKLLNGTTNEKQDEQSSILRLSKEERKRAKKEKKKQEKIAAATSHATPLPSTPCTADAPHPLSKSEAQAWWEENEILVSGPGCDAFLPTLSFAGVGFPPDLLKCTEGFARPTPIQAQCWPVLMGGRDIIGIAETGSGKTLTFVLPGLERIRKAGAPDGGRAGHVPRMLVVAPTRELAMQSAKVIDGVVEGSGLRSICLFGGVPKQEQRQALRGGVDILVATPGRLADLMEEGECDLSRVSYLVLDEADRMLDQGFEQAIRGIVSHCVPRGRRQTALFSATWPVAIQALAGEFLENPVKVTIGGEDLSSNKRVQQVVEVVGEFEREGRLRGLLTQYHGRRDNRVLVFALYKKVSGKDGGQDLAPGTRPLTFPPSLPPILPSFLPSSLLLSGSVPIGAEFAAAGVQVLRHSWRQEPERSHRRHREIQDEGGPPVGGHGRRCPGPGHPRRGGGDKLLLPLDHRRLRAQVKGGREGGREKGRQEACNPVDDLSLSLSLSSAPGSAGRAARGRKASPTLFSTRGTRAMRGLWSTPCGRRGRRCHLPF